MLLLLCPVQATAILDEARRDLKQLDKQFGADLGFEHPSDWSKAKHAARPCDFHQLCQAPDETQRAIARRWLLALEQTPDRDLVADLVGRVDQLLAALGPRRQAKAELVSIEDERKRA